MSKKISKVTIIDGNILRLDEAANIGDTIDLRDLNKVDTKIIETKIDQAKDSIYESKLNELKKSLKQEYNILLNKRVSELELEKQSLKSDLKSIKDQIEKEYELKLTKQEASYKSEKAELTHKLNKEYDDLKNTYEKEITKLENLKDNISLKKDNEYKDKINSANNEINNLKQKLKSSKESLDNEKELALAKLEANHNRELQNLRDELNDLKRRRSMSNVKHIGEDLEVWCDNEFESQSHFGMENITWQKDNEAIKGGKADFIYKVYANSEKNENELLTSAILEMKTEAEDTVVKQPNSKFFKKLDKDRNNKGLEYAILVSELEKKGSNDLLIRKVSEYKKMYIVRPQYFMPFLSIITSLANKYREILLADEAKKLKFKDLEDIKTDFNKMKEEILDRSIRHIQTHMENIIKETDKITKANNNIIDSAGIILNTHVQTVINKINDFRIEDIKDRIKATK